MFGTKLLVNLSSGVAFNFYIVMPCRRLLQSMANLLLIAGNLVQLLLIAVYCFCLLAMQTLTRHRGFGAGPPSCHPSEGSSRPAFIV